VSGVRAGRLPILRRSTDFKRLYEEGQAYHCRDFVLIIRRTGEPAAKVAFVTSRRVGNAVKRNRARRVLREALRSLHVNLSDLAVHAVFVARPSCARVKSQAVRAQMEGVLRSAGLLQPAEPKAAGEES
jgi:ribonuclease P protein component